MTIREIQTDEILTDREEAILEIFICKLALAVGVTTYSGGSVLERLKWNERQIEVMDAELKRRATRPLPAADSAAEPIRNPHAETTHSAGTVVGDRDGSSGAASRRSPATTQSGSVTIGSPEVQGLPAQEWQTVDAPRLSAAASRPARTGRGE